MSQDESRNDGQRRDIDSDDARTPGRRYDGFEGMNFEQIRQPYRLPGSNRLKPNLSRPSPADDKDEADRS